jgi:hypothetical protein
MLPLVRKRPGSQCGWTPWVNSGGGLR